MILHLIAFGESGWATGIDLKSNPLPSYKTGLENIHFVTWEGVVWLHTNTHTNVKPHRTDEREIHEQGRDNIYSSTPGGANAADVY